MKIPFLVSILFMFSEVFSEIEYKEEFPVLRTNAGDIFGTLYVPEPYKRLPVAILVAGSGPTDRNGNQPKLKNNSLKMLAEALGSNGIASLRYDKRAIGQSKIKNLVEEDLRFEHYIEDAKAWSNLVKDKNQFNQIIMVGHSEGSLIGIIASQTGIVDKFISLAGPGKSADKLLKKQLSKKPMVSYFASQIIDDLVQRKQVEVPFFLKPLFRDSVQPYLISWFNYDPSIEISKLTIPSLIIQGTNDIQVTVEDAELLSSSNETSKLIIIQGMNHILKNTKLDEGENIKSYNNPTLPLNEELVKKIVEFIKYNPIN